MDDVIYANLGNCTVWRYPVVYPLSRRTVTVSDDDGNDVKAPLYIQAGVQGVAGLVLGVVWAMLIIGGTNAYLVAELGVGTGLPSWPALSLCMSIPGGIAVGTAGAMIASSRRLP